MIYDSMAAFWARCLVAVLGILGTFLAPGLHAVDPTSEVRLTARPAADGTVEIAWDWASVAPRSWRLWRLEPQGQPRLIAERRIVDASAPESVMTVRDPIPASSPAAAYLLEWVDANEGSAVFGPFRAASPDEAEPTRRREGAARISGRTSGMLRQSGDLPDSRTFLTLVTTNGGFHRVQAAPVATALGVPLSTVEDWFRHGDARVLLGGQPLPALARNGATDFWVYVPPTDSPYYGGDAVQLAGGRSTLLAQLAAVPGTGPVARAGRVGVRFEKNLLALPSAPGDLEADVWMWEILAAGSPLSGRRTYSFVPEGLPVPAGPSEVVIDMISSSEARHEVGVELNGVPVFTDTWSGRASRRLVCPLAAGLLVGGNNQLSLTNRGDRTSTLYVNRFLVHHDQILSVTNGPLTFQSLAGGPVATGGLTTPDAEAWDLTDPSLPVQLTGLLIAPEDSGWRVTFQTVTGRRYGVFQPDHVPGFEVYRAVEASGLTATTNAVDYMVVTPAALLPAVQPLLEYRRGQGLRTRAVSLEASQDEFAAGRTTPSALLGLMKAVRGWTVPPAYLLLIGDGTYDYRGFLGLKDNLVPPLQVLTSLGRFPADTQLADADGDGVWETGVGRVPVKSAAEFAAWLVKLKSYESQPVPSTSRMLLMADYPDPAGSFISDSEVVRGILEPGYATERLYNLDNKLEPMRAGVTNALKREPMVWNYAGHGARDRLGNGYVISADVPKLPATSVPPLLVAMTCGAGYFGVPGFDAIAELLTLRADGGTIAAWSPSGFSQNASARLLNQSFARSVRASGREPSLGDVVRKTLRDNTGLQTDPFLPGLYNVLGDPATRLRLAGTANPGSVVLTAVASGPGELRMRWAGGVPPFTLQRRERLGSETWVDVLVTFGNELVFSPSSSPSFYRIRWSGAN